MKRLTVLALLISVLTSVGCTNRSSLPPGEVCTDETKAMLISEGPNSVTVTMEIYHPLDHHGAIHRCGRRSVSDGTFYQEVYQYHSEEEAHQEYERQLEDFFYQNNYIGHWQQPEFAESLSLSADEYLIMCAQLDDGTPLCKMLARYAEVVVRLSVNRTLASMSLSDFQTAIASVDTKFR